MIERGNSVRFANSSFLIRDQRNRLAAAGSKQDGLYSISDTSSNVYVGLTKDRISERPQRKIYGITDMVT